MTKLAHISYITIITLVMAFFAQTAQATVVLTGDVTTYTDGGNTKAQLSSADATTISNFNIPWYYGIAVCPLSYSDGFPYYAGAPVNQWYCSNGLESLPFSQYGPTGATSLYTYSGPNYVWLVGGTQTLNTGDYRVFWLSQDLGGNAYATMDITWDGTNVTNYYAIPPDTSTHIISVIPESNSTIIPFVASSSDRFANFNLNLLTYYNNNSSATSTVFLITTILQNNNIDYFNYSKSQFITSTTSGIVTSSFNIAENVPFGNYDLTINLFNNNLNVITSTTSINLTFGSSTNVITIEDIYGASSTNPLDISQLATSSECSISNPTGCVKNALVWAFYPNLEVIKAEILALKGKIEHKAPFGYFSMLEENMEDLSASTTAKFNIIIPDGIQAYIFDPIKTGIAGLLWFVGLIYLFKRLKHIQL